MRPKQSVAPQVRSLASGEVVQANGVKQEANGNAKTSLNVAYDHLSRQTDIGPSATTNSSLKSFLASYEQNSGSGASSQSPGTLLRSTA